MWKEMKNKKETEPNEIERETMKERKHHWEREDANSKQRYPMNGGGKKDLLFLVYRRRRGFLNGTCCGQKRGPSDPYCRHRTKYKQSLPTLLLIRNKT